MKYHALAMELTAELAKHVPSDDRLLCFARQLLAIPTAGQFKCGTANPTSVLLPDDVRRMRAMHRDGLSYGQLAIKYGMSKRQVRRICAYEQWSWVDD